MQNISTYVAYDDINVHQVFTNMHLGIQNINARSISMYCTIESLNDLNACNKLDVQAPMENERF